MFSDLSQLDVLLENSKLFASGDVGYDVFKCHLSADSLVGIMKYSDLIKVNRCQKCLLERPEKEEKRKIKEKENMKKRKEKEEEGKGKER